MKSKLLFLVLFLSGSIFGQVETVRIVPEKTFLFRGSNQEIRDWYLYVDEENIFYLANLTLDFQEIETWFKTRKNSQNIYRGLVENGQYKTVTFTRENEPESPLKFYFEQKEKNEIQLISIDDGTIYVFRIT